MQSERTVTDLLAGVRHGDEGAMEKLMSVVYDGIKVRARRQLRRLRPGETLCTTALINECFIRLTDREKLDWRDRNHFYSVATLAMRQILVDHARRRLARKRGAGFEHEQLTEEMLRADGWAIETLAVEEAVLTLTRHDPRLGRIVELLHYGGLTRQETADLMGVNERTVRRDWEKAKLFLKRALNEGQVKLSLPAAE